MLIQLCHTKVNRIYKIDHIAGPNKCRLLEIGLIRCLKIKVIYKIHKGPILIKFKDSTLAISNEEALNIFVNNEV